MALDIYLVERTNDAGWDQYEGFVVAADSEEQALALADAEGRYDPGASFSNTWVPHELIRVVRLDEQTEPGIILSSFKAG